MKVCQLTSISRPAPEIGPYVLLSGDGFYMERVFLYRHGTHVHFGRQHPSGILGVYDWSGV